MSLQDNALLLNASVGCFWGLWADPTLPSVDSDLEVDIDIDTTLQWRINAWPAETEHDSINVTSGYNKFTGAIVLLEPHMVLMSLGQAQVMLCSEGMPTHIKRITLQCLPSDVRVCNINL